MQSVLCGGVIRDAECVAMGGLWRAAPCAEGEGFVSLSAVLLLTFF